MEDNRTMKDLAREALDVQNACNLSGVVHSWSRTITRLRELESNLGTDDLNNHPVNRLFADKVAHLTGTQSFPSNDSMTSAYDWCFKRTEDR